MKYQRAALPSFIEYAFACLLVISCAAPHTSARDPGASQATVYSYHGGRWFNGSGFEPRTMYVSDGLFIDLPATPPDSVIDLAGSFVVPPFAEAHNHWLEPKAVTAYVQSYLHDGVFYVQDQANSPSVRARMDSALNRKASVDYISANQGWTGPGGHPIQIGRQFMKFGTFPSGWTDADLDRNLVMVVRDSADVAARWPRFIADRPDFAKVFLLYSEEHARRSTDSAFQFRRGIDPTLVPEIVSRAHAAGLRISAHIYTAADFRTAVAAGVNIIAHFPGTGYEPTLGIGAFKLTEQDAQLAAEHHVSVITTLHWLGIADDSAQNAMLLREVIRPNLALLRQHKVPILIGSDEFRATPLNEASVLVKTHLFTPLEAILSWSVLTPRAIFPSRRLGEFAAGYEASFLALRGDPLANFNSVRNIVLRVKQGAVLHLLEPRPAFPPLGR